ncbi:MAG: hypothetical protein L3I99_07515 [Sulfurimonas sp.]|nr:hypothetical protein [Sulfurimonas sp.]
MKKFNLFNEVIVVNKSDLQNIIAKGEEFGIDINGNIINNSSYSQKDIYIFKSCADADVELVKSFGNKYQLVEDAQRVLIKAAGNWQALIEINTPNASYDDTSADGVGEFEDKGLEEIGWNAVDFNVYYRSLVEVLEQKCEGTVLCIEQDEPYQFSGLGFIADYKVAYDVLFKYAQERIIDAMKNNEDYKRETLNSDELKVLEFFKL